MPEELRLVPRPSHTPSPTLRDVVAVFFRQRRLWVASFFLILLGTLGYGLIAPAYRAEMKILVRRGRATPSATPTLRQSPEFDRRGVSEEELNSEVELLRDKDVLVRTAQAAGLDTGKDASVDRAAEQLRRHLSVEPVRRTTLIAATYTSGDAEESARVLRCLAAAYLQRHVQVRRPSGEWEFFQQQAEQSRKELEKAEFQLMAFTRDQGVVSASMERDAALQKLSEAEAEYRRTRVALAETAQRVASLQSKLQTLPERRTTQIRNLDNPQLLERIKSRLLELQLKRTELLTRYEPSYRLVQEVDQQIAEARAALAAEDQMPLRDETTEQDANHEWAKAELLKAQVEFNGLQSRAEAMSRQLSESREAARRLGDRAITQEELLRAMKAAEENYLLYLNKREEARIGDALDERRILDVSIAEEPRVPASPVRPAWSFGVIGILLATGASTGMAFAKDYLDPAFRTPDEVLAYLGMPVLASLPQGNT